MATMAPTLPPERFGLFLALRRGLPLGLGAIALLAAMADHAHRGWWVLVAVGLISTVWPTFSRGDAYLKVRASLVRWDAFWVRALRPLFAALGREDEWILSFCGFHNAKVREAMQGRKARKAMVLLPHCIQLARCKAPVIGDLAACYECHLCTIEDVLHATLEKRWEVRLTNRSHKAYREARAYHPDLIVAVSCTDRLLKGLVKVAETPAYVIPLGLPHGMCVDTTFDTGHLLAAMDALTEPKPKLAPVESEASAS
jgi:hypothetical protein